MDVGELVAKLVLAPEGWDGSVAAGLSLQYRQFDSRSGWEYGVQVKLEAGPLSCLEQGLKAPSLGKALATTSSSCLTIALHSSITSLNAFAVASLTWCASVCTLICSSVSMVSDS